MVYNAGFIHCLARSLASRCPYYVPRLRWRSMRQRSTISKRGEGAPARKEQASWGICTLSDLVVSEEKTSVERDIRFFVGRTYCEFFHHIPRCTWWPCGLFRRFFESGQPPQTFILRSRNSVGWFLPGKIILLLSLVALTYMISFRRSTGVHSYGKTIYG